jgi:cellulose synthase (UDP-forming)
LAPLLYAVFGITVMRCSFEQMLIFWLPMYVCGSFCIRLLSDDIRSVKWTNIYEICLFPFLLIPILAESFGMKKKDFVVTDKAGKQEWKWWYVLPFVCLIALSVVGIWRIAEQSYAEQTNVYLLLLFWLIYNLYQLLFALIFVIGCRKLPANDETTLVHDLKQDRFGRTSLFAIIVRRMFRKKKGEKV